MGVTGLSGLALDGVQIPMNCTFVIGAEAANVINVAVQLLADEQGAEYLDATSGAWVMWYLADDAAGDTPTTVAPDGGVAVGTDGTIIEWAANLSGVAVSEVDGDIDINITHAAGAKTVYLVVALPTGRRVVSGAITFA